MNKKNLRQSLIILFSLLILLATWYALSKGEADPAVTLHIHGNSSALLTEWVGQIIWN